MFRSGALLELPVCTSGRVQGSDKTSSIRCKFMCELISQVNLLLRCEFVSWARVHISGEFVLSGASLYSRYEFVSQVWVCVSGEFVV